MQSTKIVYENAVTIIKVNNVQLYNKNYISCKDVCYTVNLLTPVITNKLLFNLLLLPENILYRSSRFQVHQVHAKILYFSYSSAGWMDVSLIR